MIGETWDQAKIGYPTVCITFHCAGTVYPFCPDTSQTAHSCQAGTNLAKEKRVGGPTVTNIVQATPRSSSAKGVVCERVTISCRFVVSGDSDNW